MGNAVGTLEAADIGICCLLIILCGYLGEKYLTEIRYCYGTSHDSGPSMLSEISLTFRSGNCQYTIINKAIVSIIADIITLIIEMSALLYNYPPL